MHIFALGNSPPAADRVSKVLGPWTTNGDGQAAVNAAGPTKADPDVRQEITKLVECAP